MALELTNIKSGILDIKKNLFIGDDDTSWLVALKRNTVKGYDKVQDIEEGWYIKVQKEGNTITLTLAETEDLSIDLLKTITNIAFHAEYMGLEDNQGQIFTVRERWAPTNTTTRLWKYYLQNTTEIFIDI